MGLMPRICLQMWNLRIVRRFLFALGWHLLFYRSLPSVCVCVLCSHPGGCHGAASPWKTPECLRWRCAAGAGAASWRNRCTGAERSACCGRWVGGHSSWRALKHNKASVRMSDFMTPRCSTVEPQILRYTHGAPKNITSHLLQPLKCVGYVTCILCSRGLFEPTEFYLTFKLRSRNVKKYQPSASITGRWVEINMRRHQIFSRVM